MKQETSNLTVKVVLVGRDALETALALTRFRPCCGDVHPDCKRSWDQAVARFRAAAGTAKEGK
jgi:hypothetical protein